MTPRDYQIQGANDIVDKWNQYGMCYLAWQERTGKTLAAIMACEKFLTQSDILIITKKQAIQGWTSTLSQVDKKNRYTVINYHSLHKIEPQYFSIVILDESHSTLSGYPTPGKIWKEVKIYAENSIVLYISATPYAQGPYQLYHQFALTKKSPWYKFQSFYKWYDKYALRTPSGEFHKVYIRGGHAIINYQKVMDSVIMNEVEHLFLRKTRTAIGFEHEPEDVVHKVVLSADTKKMYNNLIKARVMRFDEHYLVCDSPIKLRVSLHMLEGGVAKVEDNYLVLDNMEKIHYIKDTFGDSKNMAIMYHYIAEGTKLRQHFEYAEILQATTFAEGIDLHHIDTLIIYSQDFSAAKYIQRRARQCNMHRELPIKVHFINTEGKSVSSQVYDTVCVKRKNFTDKDFEETLL